MSDNNSDENGPLEIIAETERFAVLKAEDADGEAVYNIELGAVTIHLFEDEWEEIIELIDAARS